MSFYSKRGGVLLNVSFYLLAALLVVTPLIFLKDINNGYELAKASSIKILGGIFCLAAALHLTLKLFNLSNKEPLALIDKNLDLAMVLFLAAALISTILSVNTYISYRGEYERQIGFITYIYVFLIYFFASQVLYTSGKTYAILKIIEVAAALVAISAILQALDLDPFGITVSNRRANATFGNAVFAGGFLILAYPFALTEAFKRENKFVRAGSPLIILAGIIATQTRTAYVACFVESALVILIYPSLSKTSKTDFRKILRNSGLILGITALTVALLIFFFPENVFVKRMTKIADIVHSPRWFLWRDSFKAFWRYPVFGGGIATFQISLTM